MVGAKVQAVTAITVAGACQPLAPAFPISAAFSVPPASAQEIQGQNAVRYQGRTGLTTIRSSVSSPGLLTGMMNLFPEESLSWTPNSAGILLP